MALHRHFSGPFNYSVLQWGWTEKLNLSNCLLFFSNWREGKDTRRGWLSGLEHGAPNTMVVGTIPVWVPETEYRCLYQHCQLIDQVLGQSSMEWKKIVCVCLCICS